MNFSEACAFLDSLQMFRIRLGLETMQRLLEALDHPEQRLACIHIAGTNGKGSTAATLYTLLTQAGFRAGLYTSPHLASVRERFALGGAFITEAEFAAQMTALTAVFTRTGFTPTWFECATLLAFRWFAERQVEVVVLETGLGGRLDATNVVRPLVSVITDISHDHEAYLGSDLKSIAAEKAGIIKPGVPVVCSGQTGESTEVIAEFCARLGSPFFLFGRDFFAEPTPGGLRYRGIHSQNWQYLPLALVGAHQARNAALALAALDVVQGHFPVGAAERRSGLAAVRWPGRMEYLEAQGRHLVLDGAHNEAGLETLLTALQEREAGRRLVLLWGNMADKQLSAARHRLFARAAVVVLTRAETQRSIRPEELLFSLPPAEQAKCRCVEPVTAALTTALEATGPDDLLCVAGSLYLVGQVRALLLPGVAI